MDGMLEVARLQAWARTEDACLPGAEWWWSASSHRFRRMKNHLFKQDKGGQGVRVPPWWWHNHVVIGIVVS